MEGWIKLHRKIFDWKWYKDGNTFRLFIHLLLSANHEDRKQEGIIVKRGQLMTGRSELHEITGLSERAIRTCINHLKSTSELTIKSTSKYSIITLCNYDKYNSQKSSTDQQPTSKSTSKYSIITLCNYDKYNSQKSSTDQQIDQQIDHIEEQEEQEEEEKEKEKEEIIFLNKEEEKKREAEEFEKWRIENDKKNAEFIERERLKEYNENKEYPDT